MTAPLSDQLVIAYTKSFQVEVGRLKLVPDSLKGVKGYRLRNRLTGLVEQEGNSYAQAVRAMHSNEKFLQEVTQDPEGKEVQDETNQLLQKLGLAQDDLPGDDLPPFDPAVA